MGQERRAIRYNSVGLFLSESPADDPKGSAIRFFNRVQSAAFSVGLTRENLTHIGSEDFLTRKIVAEATMALDVQYLLTDGYEEKTLGLNITPSGQAMNGGTIHSGINEDKNAFLVIGDEAFDLTGYANRVNGYSGTDVLGIGNCFITNYTITAGVGDVAKASVQVAASNALYSCMDSHSWITGTGGAETVAPGYYSLLNQLGALINLQNSDGIELQTLNSTDRAYGIPFPSLNLPEGGTEISGAAIGDQAIDDSLLSQDRSFVELEDESEIGLQLNQPAKLVSNPGTGVLFTPSLYKSAVKAITPGGINVRVNNINVGGPIISGKSQGTCTKGAASIQNFSISLPFNREDLKGFSSMHVYGRKMKFPQLGTISFSILSSAFETGNFKNIFCDDENYQIEIDLSNQCDFTCRPSSEHETFMRFIINNAKLDGYSMKESLGSFSTVDCNFSFGISRGNGFFMSGSYPSS